MLILSMCLKRVLIFTIQSLLFVLTICGLQAIILFLYNAYFLQKDVIQMFKTIFQMFKTIFQRKGIFEQEVIVR